MASNSETGHSKNVANFLRLIGVCQSFGTKYNPSKAALKITALTTTYNASDTIVGKLHATETTLDNTSNTREILYAQLRPFVTRLNGAIEATDATEQTIDDVRTIIRKIRGTKVKRFKAGAELAKTTNADTTDEMPTPILTPKEISTSQQSFDMLVDHFDKLVKRLTAEPLYLPNENELKLTAITAYFNDLRAKNKDVSDAVTNYDTDLITRNQTLYAPKTGLVETAKEVKKYVLSVYGATSPKYKMANSIPFRNLSKE